MSAGGFHVHGPHDHAVEHAAHESHGDDEGFGGRLAVLTAVLATVGALFSYQGGATQNNAMIFKNNAAIKKTEAKKTAFFNEKTTFSSFFTHSCRCTNGFQAL